MAEKRCDIFEAKKTLGISRRKSYGAIVREKKGGNSRTTQRKEEETNTRRESEENAIKVTRTHTNRKRPEYGPPPAEQVKKKIKTLKYKT